ncbi:hypothetical protein PPERSA_07958 [Pseudocohnilembus persalinus]|uniref:Uncharacterized protein n=1 Tax=Pseudocohnilembus persalinus TaxID=266149 RepID=A0A0V0QBD6_PSEPJ|nr:hypothetical protein PPERSA_07958 [Pseudocohnilembus persalinus]|eukprot:KRW99473.1 hypothetical protein PPERSA_07958 [Pseudocohnilembus persalinus]
MGCNYSKSQKQTVKQNHAYSQKQNKTREQYYNKSIKNFSKSYKQKTPEKQIGNNNLKSQLSINQNLQKYEKSIDSDPKLVKNKHESIDISQQTKSKNSGDSKNTITFSSQQSEIQNNLKCQKNSHINQKTYIDNQNNYATAQYIGSKQNDQKKDCFNIKNYNENNFRNEIKYQNNNLIYDNTFFDKCKQQIRPYNEFILQTVKQTQEDSQQKSIKGKGHSQEIDNLQSSQIHMQEKQYELNYNQIQKSNQSIANISQYKLTSYFLSNKQLEQLYSQRLKEQKQQKIQQTQYTKSKTLSKIYLKTQKIAKQYDKQQQYESQAEQNPKYQNNIIPLQAINDSHLNKFKQNKKKTKKNSNFINLNYNYLTKQYQKDVAKYQIYTQKQNTDLFPLHLSIQSNKNRSNRISLKMQKNQLIQKRPQFHQKIELANIDKLPKMLPIQNSLEHNFRDMSIQTKCY